MALTLREFLDTVEGGWATVYRLFVALRFSDGGCNVCVLGSIIERALGTLESQGIASVEALGVTDPDKDLTWPRGTLAGDKALIRAGVAKWKADRKALRAAAAEGKFLFLDAGVRGMAMCAFCCAGGGQAADGSADGRASGMEEKCV